MAGLLVKKEDLVMKENMVIGNLVDVEIVNNTAYGYYVVKGEIIVIKSSETGFNSILLADKISKLFKITDYSVIELEPVEGYIEKFSSRYNHFFPEAICLEMMGIANGFTNIDSVMIHQLLGRGCVEATGLVELELMEIASVKGIKFSDDFVMTSKYFSLRDKYGMMDDKGLRLESK